MKTDINVYFFNTLSGKKERFTSIEKEQVKIYTCGVTVYDECHIGHARGAVNFDVLRRFLTELGYKVTYVKNYTDIDDKLIKRAQENNESVKELAERMIALHDRDMDRLQVLYPDIAPKATDHIEEMIHLIKRLEENGFAYQSEKGGDVFFAVAKFKDYGKLSGKRIEELQAGSRIDVDDLKRDPMDFVLWKQKKEGEPYWDSPWGQGRPGWHIECSAMSEKYLGKPFDIHGGGSDLIFPHHENELAQSCAVGNTNFANYWLHNGMIRVDNHKMSKSLNNFITINELLDKFPTDLLRFFIVSTQYRKPIHFSDEALKQAEEKLRRLYISLERFDKVAIAEYTLTTEEEKEFFDLLADDLNTPMAIAYIFEKVKLLNKEEIGSPQVPRLYKQIQFASNILGILTEDPRAWLTQTTKQEDELTEEEIEAHIEARKNARENKDWQEADKIRLFLEEKGIVLKDEHGKTNWIRQ